jgi:hypothetical protein
MLFHGGVSPCSLNYDLDNRISAEVRRIFNSYTRINHSSAALAAAVTANAIASGNVITSFEFISKNSETFSRR